MKYKSNVTKGILILIFLIIGIIMPLIFANIYQPYSLLTNFSFSQNSFQKDAKAMNVYFPEETQKDPAESIGDSQNGNLPGEDTIADSDNNSSNLPSKIEEESVDELIEAYIESIEERDLERGMELLEKLDVDYLLSFDRQNLSEDDKDKIRNYLRENLSQEEYEEVLSLIGKYIGLIQ